MVSIEVSGCINEEIWPEEQEITPQNDGSIIFDAGVTEVTFQLVCNIQNET